ncbi:hypothetical protein, conserved [Eimeria tenella]|uniref:Uncharacterized protein n=1 Tax=Eimeria tenella TaxID=5802 RepID=U6KPJ1_EIMTE|nr:hypothetical protein, conserved [Eimeria tenella]CDJ39896.1 hypothetical protein, conserved [Eimeria tenella]|eukprot:XP_013230649.1 hypothetical protein, conserved [Eimeria tenella]
MYEGQDNVSGLGELPTLTTATRAGPAATTTAPAPVAPGTAPAAGEAIPAAPSQASTYAECPSGPSGEGCALKGSAGVAAGLPPEAAAANAAADAAAEADAAANLAAYRQLHHQRYAERLLREAAEAELIRRQREEQIGVELARRLQQEEFDRLAMENAANRERERQLAEARFAASATSFQAPTNTAVAIAGADTEGHHYALAPTGGEAMGDDGVRAPLRTNYTERLLGDSPSRLAVSSFRSQRLFEAYSSPMHEERDSDTPGLWALLRQGTWVARGDNSELQICGFSARHLLPCCLWLLLMVLPLIILVYELFSIQTAA